MINEQEVSFTDYFNFDKAEMYDESFLNLDQNDQDDDGHNNSPQLQTQSSPETKHLEYKDALEIKRKMCPKFTNPDCNLLNWTFVQIDAPLYFNYDTADGCFHYEGLPTELLFNFNQGY
ncbi:924_t:CDS:2 [Funneliformis mosseae]|uniref:924_t:CDS:1 n=1 Tax=Funneliformis mosseae TaxID=27381 RepID=A0A9N9ETU8_FUNMO|nr:924_t:CDS:2 [Funneliformis mosseae]